MQQRCLHHPDREAAARCPSCQRYFCRECVTEHEGKVTCAECLAKLAAPPASSGRTRLLGWAMLSLLGFLLTWLIFYCTGAILSRMPSSFHGDS